MADFTVDVGGLEALGTDLDRTCENIDTATKKLADAAKDSIGTAELDEACEDFRSEWEEGLSKLREAVDEIRGGLSEAQKAYADVEGDLRASLGKMAQGVESAGLNGGGHE
ncbi:hypothetical protein GCM10009676_24190 [Prauserella halophila]|uniref:Nitrate/nitrite sensing protein domain-containing protein n=1 Tax=Prauserella halophila TaxID=185641 RepID=A0ABN1W7E2_9PSEU|nr:type VII secretion target [Prauserella halophila]MCP2234806.1 Excreted virulence factor EspC, type VII ESX diderm [Prauserella halophila]